MEAIRFGVVDAIAAKKPKHVTEILHLEVCGLVDASITESAIQIRTGGVVTQSMPAGTSTCC
jgi:hypothetical protein